MKFYEVDMWVDGMLTITVMAEDEAEARTRAINHIDVHVGGVDHGIYSVEEVTPNDST